MLTMYEEFTAFIAQLININICLKKDFVLELIDKFDIPIKKLNYPNNNLDNLSISLNFYKGFNLEYYNIINQGLNSQDIIISDEFNSFVNTSNGRKLFLVVLFVIANVKLKFFRFLSFKKGRKGFYFFL